MVFKGRFPHTSLGIIEYEKIKPGFAQVIKISFLLFCKALCVFLIFARKVDLILIGR